MVVELAAVRLLAPWFGTSLVVWTNVIAVILLALALGYLAGARLAARAHPLQALGWTLLSAGALVAWLPFLGASLSRSLLPEHVTLDEAASLVGWGSLAVSLVAFLPPALLLGTVCPLVVEALARARGFSAGKAGGSVLFVSTLGSLAGVFGTSHLLLPTLGLRRTFLLASTALLAAALLTWLFVRRRPAASQALLLVGWALSLTAGPTRPALADGIVELERRESRYQSLRVVEDRSLVPPMRFLQVNEGFDSYQSVWQPSPGLLPPGFYYNDFLLPLSFDGGDRPWRLLVLGLGAGTVVRVFEATTRGMEVVGVELDPGVVALARAHFDLPADSPDLSTWSGMDGRVALRAAEGGFDQVVLDCYANQVEIPPHLCTVEFFREARASLREEGWLTANLGGFAFEDPVVAAVAASCAQAFERPVLLVRVPESRNFMLVARRGGDLPWTGEGLAAGSASSPLGLGARRLPGFTRLVQPSRDATLLTDDRCPIEELQLRSIAQARALRASR